MRKPFVAMLIASAFSSLNVHAADILQVFKEALENDAQYASARANLAAGQEKVVQGRAGLLPVIAFSGNYSHSDLDVSPSTGGATRSFSSNNYTLSLSQPLFHWANWQQYEQSKLSVAVSEVQFAQIQQDLILRVAQAYFDILAAQDALSSVQAQKIAITEQLASAKRNFEVGNATITDTHEAQARYDLALAQEYAAQNELEIKRTALQQIIGKPPAELTTLRLGIKLSAPEPAQIDKWIESAEHQNYGVITQQLAFEIAQRDISKNRAGHYPTLDLVASRNRSNQNAFTAFSSLPDSSVIGLQWTIPLFSGFSVDSKVRESIALEEKARYDLENARRTAVQGVRQSYLGVNSGLEQVKALEAAEVSSQSALESNKLGYQVGVRINIDVLNAQQQLYSTQKDLAKARYDTVMNGLRLKSAAGTLKEKDLAEINMLLMPGKLSQVAAITATEPVVAVKPIDDAFVSKAEDPEISSAVAEAIAKTKLVDNNPVSKMKEANEVLTTTESVADIKSFDDAPIGKVIEDHEMVSTIGQPMEVQPFNVAGSSANNADHDMVLNTINNWAKAWSAKDVKSYLGFYNGRFKMPGNQSHKVWMDKRRARIEGKKYINIKVAAPQIMVDGSTATVKFCQIYVSNHLIDRSNKTIVLEKYDDNWRIVQESSVQIEKKSRIGS